MKAYRKDILRTILREKKRFLAIMIIVILGMTMLSGLKASCDDLRVTADAFFDRQHLHDLYVLSTMGLTQEDLDAVSGMDGVEQVTGFYSETVHTGVNGSFRTASLKAVSLDGMDQPAVQEGRLPERKNEIAVTQNYLKDTEKQIGDTVTIRENSTEKTEESDETVSLEDEKPNFPVTEYTITGTVIDVTDINAMEGATAFRSTAITDYVFFVPFEAVESEIYTGMGITLNGTREMMCFGDAYDERVDAFLEELSGRIRNEREQARTEAVRSEADEKISDAEEEMEESFADAEKKLNDAAKEIADGEQELRDGEQMLYDQLAEGEAQIASGKEQIAAGYAELESGEQQLQKAQEQIRAQKSEIAQKEQELAEGEEALDDAEEKLLASEQELTEQEELLTEGETALAQAKQELASREEEMETAQLELTAGMQQIADEKTSLTGQRQELLQQDAALEAAITELQNSSPATEEEQMAVDAQIRELTGQRTQISGALTQIDAGLAQITEKEQELVQAQAQLDGGKSQLEQGKTELAAKEEELQNARSQLEAGKKEIASGKSQIAQQREQIGSGKEQIESGRRQLQTAEEEISSGLAEAAAGRETLREKEEELLSGEASMYEETGKARQELEEGKAELEDGKREYDKALAEYQDKKEEALEAISRAKEKVLDLGEAKWYLQTRYNLSGYNNVSSDAGAIESIGTVFAFMFLIVAILISLTTISRLVEEERGLIGTYQALGFTDGEIRKKYLLYAGAACLAGCIGGNLMGFVVLPNIIFLIFHTMYQFPVYTIGYNFLYGLGGSLMFLIGVMLAAFFTCETTLRHLPAVLMRPKAPKAGTRVLLERIPPIWRKLSFLNKVTVRNLFRYKKRMFMTIIGIAGCTTLLMCGFAIKDTVTDLLPKQYENVDRYDWMAISDASDNDALTALVSGREEITQFLNLNIQSVTLKNGNGDSETIQMYVIPDDVDTRAYFQLKDVETGEAVSLDGSGIVVSRNAGIILGFGKGDTLSIQNMQVEEHEVKVSAIVEYFMGNAIYMPQSLYEKTFGDYECNAVLARLGDDVDQTAFAQEMDREDVILSSISVQSLKDEFSTAFRLMNMVVYVVLVLSAALAFVVLFTLSTTNISERQRELATIKVLGFHDREVHHYVNKETIILTLIGIGIGIPLGVPVSMSLTTILKIPSMYFEVSIHPLSYFLSAGLALVFAICVGFITNRILNRIDPVEALKSIE